MGFTATAYINDKHKEVVEALQHNRIWSKIINDFLESSLESYFADKKEELITIMDTISKMRKIKYKKFVLYYKKHNDLKEWINNLFVKFNAGQEIDFVAIAELNKEIKEFNIDKELLIQLFGDIRKDRIDIVLGE